MKLFKVFFSIFVIVVLFVSIAYLFFPRYYRFEQTVEINRRPQDVFTYMSDLKNWEQWSAWDKSMDSTLYYFYSKKSDSLGAKQYFNGSLLGTGRFAISNYKPNELIGYNLALHSGAVNAHGTFLFAPKNNSTLLTWVDSGDVGYNPVFRYMIPSKKKSTEAAFADGLKKIKQNLER